MRKQLSTDIEKTGKELDEQLSALPEFEIGSEEQKVAIQNLKETANVYSSLLKTQSELESSELNNNLKKKAEIREWVRVARDVLIGVGSIVFGYLTIKQIGLMEAIDDANGVIPSLPIRSQRQLIRSLGKDWLSGRLK